MRLLVVALATLVVPLAAAAATDPDTVYRTTFKNANARHSVHYVSSAGGSSIVGDAGRTEGVQYVTFTENGKTGHAEIRVVANTAYVRGDAFTLQNYMGVPAIDAAASAWKWLYLKPTDQGFATVAQAVRIGSLLSAVAAPGPHRSIPHGVRSVVKTGGGTTTTTMYVNSVPLPVKVVIANP